MYVCLQTYMYDRLLLCTFAYKYVTGSIPEVRTDMRILQQPLQQSFRFITYIYIQIIDLT